jgi:hypothetical protein
VLSAFIDDSLITAVHWSVQPMWHLECMTMEGIA